MLIPVAPNSDWEWKASIPINPEFSLASIADARYVGPTLLPPWRPNLISQNDAWSTITVLTFHADQIPRLDEIIPALPPEIREFVFKNTLFVFSQILGEEIEQEHEQMVKELDPDHYLLKEDKWHRELYEKSRKRVCLDSNLYHPSMVNKWAAKTYLFCPSTILSKERAKELEKSPIYPQAHSVTQDSFLPAYLDKETNKVYLQRNQHAHVSYAWKSEDSTAIGFFDGHGIVGTNNTTATLVGMLITYHYIGGYYGFFKPSVDETIPQLVADGRFQTGEYIFFSEPFGDGLREKYMINYNVHVGITYVFSLIDLIIS